MVLKDIEVRIDKLVAQAVAALGNARRSQSSSTPALVPEEWAELRAAGLAFIESTFGREHSYYVEYSRKLASSWDYEGKYALGILRAIQDQIKSGWVTTTRGIVSGEVFSDFLEMAEHLVGENYKDPAAVLAGGVLEEHLRFLSSAASLPLEDIQKGKVVPRKADLLNAELKKANRYSVIDQKQITTWLSLRNNAAHGKYSEYTIEQVKFMIDGVRNFVSRTT